MREGGENTVKHRYNEKWRERDRAYRKLPDALLEELYGTISALAESRCPKQKRGRPPKITPAKAAFLAVIKEHHHEMPYRDLASSKHVKWLGISGVHYTAIQKAIARRVLAELVSSEDTFVPPSWSKVHPPREFSSASPSPRPRA